MPLAGIAVACHRRVVCCMLYLVCFTRATIAAHQPSLFSEVSSLSDVKTFLTTFSNPKTGMARRKKKLIRVPGENVRWSRYKTRIMQNKGPIIYLFPRPFWVKESRHFHQKTFHVRRKTATSVVARVASFACSVVGGPA